MRVPRGARHRRPAEDALDKPLPRRAQPAHTEPSCSPTRGFEAVKLAGERLDEVPRDAGSVVAGVGSEDVRPALSRPCPGIEVHNYHFFYGIPTAQPGGSKTMA
jgi:hypothetical protein